MGWRRFIANRYFFAKKKEGFIATISLFSIIGITIGVATLIIVTAVMNGFDKDLASRIIGIYSDITVETARGLPQNSQIRHLIHELDSVKSTSSYIQGQAVIKIDKSLHGAIVRGIEGESDSNLLPIDSFIQRGKRVFEENEIILGVELAQTFNLSIGDTVAIISPVSQKTFKYTVSGLFKSGMFDYDMNVVFIRLADSQILFKAPEVISGFNIRKNAPFSLEETKREINQIVKGRAVVRTWAEKNENLFNALQLEKLVMTIILTLIIIVACFNIISVLTMTIQEKTKDIGILKALGAKRIDIVMLFLINGSYIGFLGCLFGGVIGYALCYLIDATDLIKIPNDIYYLERLPIEVVPLDIACILGGSLFLSLFVSIYPAWKAASINPVEALRYE